LCSFPVPIRHALGFKVGEHRDLSIRLIRCYVVINRLKQREAKRMRVLGYCASLLFAGVAGTAWANDYPTSARADYVFGCMASNGQTREMLDRCSCSIDVIASILPHERYVQAETILRMRQVPGERTGIFREGEHVNKIVDDLKRAQAESEVRCF
jgi:hypothetical protein